MNWEETEKGMIMWTQCYTTVTSFSMNMYPFNWAFNIAENISIM